LGVEGYDYAHDFTPARAGTTVMSRQNGRRMATGNSEEKMRKRLIGLLALLLSLALVTTACGIIGGDDEAQTTPVIDDPSTSDSDSSDSATDVGVDDDTPVETIDDVVVTPVPAVSAYSGAGLSGLNVVDSRTFTVTLINPDPGFPARLAYMGFAPLSSVFFDDPVAFEDAPIGNGPFMIDGTWDHNTSIRVVPNLNYAGMRSASLTSLTFNIYDDVCTTGYLHAQAAFVDVVECIPARQLPYVADDFGDGYDRSAAMTLHYYAFPSYVWGQYPLELRQALSMAIDRQAIVDEIFFGSATAAVRAVPPVLSEFGAPACANWVHNPDGARDAFEAYGGLEALGETPIVLWHGANDTQDAVAAALAKQLIDVLDIAEVQFESRQSTAYLNLLDDQAVTGPSQGEWSAGYVSPLNFLEPLFGSGSSLNTSGYSSARFDRAIANGDAAAAEAILCGDVGIVPIYASANRYVSNLSVNNAFKDVRGHMNWGEMIGGDVVAAIAEPQRLAPPVTYDSEGLEVLEVLFSNLVEYDHHSRSLDNVVAESIVTTDDGLTWTITVADGWTFHDGEPVSAYSFVDAWNWTANGENAAANNVYFNVIEGWDALNG
jgi:ABC-type oligopeptide transport system substrate-binding subunit